MTPGSVWLRPTPNPASAGQPRRCTGRTTLPRRRRRAARSAGDGNSRRETNQTKTRAIRCRILCHQQSTGAYSKNDHCCCSVTNEGEAINSKLFSRPSWNVRPGARADELCQHLAGQVFPFINVHMFKTWCGIRSQVKMFPDELTTVKWNRRRRKRENVLIYWIDWTRGNGKFSTDLRISNWGRNRMISHIVSTSSLSETEKVGPTSFTFPACSRGIVDGPSRYYLAMLATYYRRVTYFRSASSL